MDSKYELICLDSSVFIGKLKGEICNGIKRDLVFDQIWRQAGDGKIRICISAITIAEVFKSKFKPDDAKIKLTKPNCEEFLELIEKDFLDVIEIDRETALLAHALCREYDVMPNDGLQLASALKAECNALLAWDRPLVGKIHPKISIENPTFYIPDLFDKGTEIATKEEIEEYERQNPRPLKKTTTTKPLASVVRSGDGSDGKGKARKGDSGNGKAKSPKEVATKELKRPDA